MTDDIVTRLRRHCHTEYPMGDGQVFRLKMPLLSEAADEIERLRTDVKRWRNWAEEFFIPTPIASVRCAIKCEQPLAKPFDPNLYKMSRIFTTFARR